MELKLHFDCEKLRPEFRYKGNVGPYLGCYLLAVVGDTRHICNVTCDTLHRRFGQPCASCYTEPRSHQLIRRGHHGGSLIQPANLPCVLLY